jgi:hypothetical protein
VLDLDDWLSMLSAVWIGEVERRKTLLAMLLAAGAENAAFSPGRNVNAFRFCLSLLKLSDPETALIVCYVWIYRAN